MSEISPDVALRAALSAADAASRSLMADFARRGSGADLKAWMKSPGALVTEADLAADRAIAEALRGSGVDAAFVSEESTSGNASDNTVWLVDPLCGTVPFRGGMPHWGVNIALRQGDALTAGVVALPPLGRVLAAADGRVVTLNGERYEGRDPGLPLDQSVIGLEIDGGEEWSRMLKSSPGGESRLKWPGAVSHTNTFASAAYPVAMVCMGGMSGVVFYRIDSVHLAAGALIAQELGIVVSDEHGQPLDWRSVTPFPVAVVAWPSAHGALIDAMSRE